MYALVCETLKFKPVLESLIKDAGLADADCERPLLLILVYELILGQKRKIQGGGAVKRIVVEKASALRAALAKVKAERGATENIDLLSPAARLGAKIPRYARVNRVLDTVESVVRSLSGDVKQPCVPPTRDAHIPSLLRFPPGTDLHDHVLVTEGRLILQDKASCFSVCALDPPIANGDYIDACAAPGNKTSHLIARLHASEPRSYAPTVTAFERDRRRAQTLTSRLGEAGVAMSALVPGAKGRIAKGQTPGGRVRVVVREGSFLDADPADFSNVTAIVVDPTCSGSGMVGRIDHLLREDAAGTGAEKIKRIASFQKRILGHALSFPSVSRVVYSTCSVHSAENEQVVAAMLEKFPDFSLVRAMPKWPRRGQGKGMEHCVRTDPQQDLTTGFFVAVFQRHGKAKVETKKAAPAQLAPSTPKNKRRCPGDRGGGKPGKRQQVPAPALRHNGARKRRKKTKRAKVISRFGGVT